VDVFEILRFALNDNGGDVLFQILGNLTTQLQE
jgi:hypothetical protein